MLYTCDFNRSTKRLGRRWPAIQLSMTSLIQRRHKITVRIIRFICLPWPAEKYRRLGARCWSSKWAIFLSWPLSEERFRSSFELFYGLHWSDGLISIYHLYTVFTELATLVVVGLALKFYEKNWARRPRTNTNRKSFLTQDAKTGQESEL